MYTRKNLNKFALKSDIHNKNTRYKNKLSVPLFRLQKSNKSFLGNCVRFYNKISPKLTDLKENKFKEVIKKILIKKAYYSIDEYINDKEIWNSI